MNHNLETVPPMMTDSGATTLCAKKLYSSNANVHWHTRRNVTFKKRLMEILACPIDKHHPLDLHVFAEKDEIVEGVIICPECLRWYPIRDEIPEMLPDEMRKRKDDLPFLKKWKSQIPKKILSEGKPFNLESSN